MLADPLAGGKETHYPFPKNPLSASSFGPLDFTSDTCVCLTQFLVFSSPIPAVLGPTTTVTSFGLHVCHSIHFTSHQSQSNNILIFSDNQSDEHSETADMLPSLVS